MPCKRAGTKLSMAEFERFSPEEVRKYVLEKIPQIDANVLDKIVEHKIDGETFLVLNEEYLREVAPLLGDRLKIKKLIVQLQAEESVVSYCIITIMLYFQDHI